MSKGKLRPIADMSLLDLWRLAKDLLDDPRAPKLRGELPGEKTATGRQRFAYISLSPSQGLRFGPDHVASEVLELAKWGWHVRLACAEALLTEAVRRQLGGLLEKTFSSKDLAFPSFADLTPERLLEELGREAQVSIYLKDASKLAETNIPLHLTPGNFVDSLPRTSRGFSLPALLTFGDILNIEAKLRLPGNFRLACGVECSHARHSFFWIAGVEDATGQNCYWEEVPLETRKKAFELLYAGFLEWAERVLANARAREEEFLERCGYLWALASQPMRATLVKQF